MNPKRTPPLLKEAVELLVKHFGIDRVQAALAKSKDSFSKATLLQLPPIPKKSNHKLGPNITDTIERFRQTDEEKFYLLKTFYMNLKDATVLPESQDIRQFAQDIGLKEIAGKSRKDLIPKLMRFLSERATERLRSEINKAANVSEHQRQQGFSILTDKLLGEK